VHVTDLLAISSFQNCLSFCRKSVWYTSGDLAMF